MRTLNDHEIKFWCDSALYVALKHLAEADDRATGEYIRHVLKRHVHSLVSAECQCGASPETGLVQGQHGDRDQ